MRSPTPALCTVLALAAMAGVATPLYGQSTGRVFGRVLEPTSKRPVPGVLITGPNGAEVTTDSLGRFDFGPLAEPDIDRAVELHATAPCFTPQERRMHPGGTLEASGVVVWLPIDADKGFHEGCQAWRELPAVFGHIFDGVSGEPIENAQIFFSSPTLQHHETDSTGVFEFGNVRTGNHEIIVSAPCYALTKVAFQFYAMFSAPLELHIPLTRLARKSFETNSPPQFGNDMESCRRTGEWP